MMARRKFSKEFKEAAIRRLQGGQTAAEVARALEVHPSELHRWRHELDEHGERAFQGVGKKRSEESRVAERHHRAELHQPVSAAQAHLYRRVRHACP